MGMFQMKKDSKPDRRNKDSNKVHVLPSIDSQPSLVINHPHHFPQESDIRRAIAENQFFVHFQPKVEPKTGKILGAEALIRWHHPEWGFLPPNEFIPLAEESGLIIELGDWVLATVCKQIQQWENSGIEIVPISINISAKHFLKEDLVTSLVKVLRETNIESKWIELEITETSLLENEETVDNTIKLLTQLGVAISLDDFGTGYSSITYLKKYKVNFLKIDRSFINGIGIYRDDEAIIKSILYLARELKMKVVAEGVETEQQLEFLIKHHCDVIQGFLYSKPVIAEDFITLLANRRIIFKGMTRFKKIFHIEWNLLTAIKSRN
jgi:EAL domain-containing protein (putative c-di-GMP-specific phosphodiesterase class I)